MPGRSEQKLSIEIERDLTLNAGLLSLNIEQSLVDLFSIRTLTKNALTLTCDRDSHVADLWVESVWIEVVLKEPGGLLEEWT